MRSAIAAAVAATAASVTVTPKPHAAFTTTTASTSTTITATAITGTGTVAESKEWSGWRRHRMPGLLCWDGVAVHCRWDALFKVQTGPGGE